jgi:hypothetical protein
MTKKTESRQLLEGMMNDTTYVTTRGTMGDAEGVTIVDEEMIKYYENCEVVKLADLKEINDEAYEDINYFIKRQCPGTSENDYYVIINGCEYMLAW